MIGAEVIPGEVDESGVKQPAPRLPTDWRIQKGAKLAKQPDGSSMPGSLLNP